RCRVAGAGAAARAAPVGRRRRAGEGRLSPQRGRRAGRARDDQHPQSPVGGPDGEDRGGRPRPRHRLPAQGGEDAGRDRVRHRRRRAGLARRRVPRVPLHAGAPEHRALAGGAGRQARPLRRRGGGPPAVARALFVPEALKRRAVVPALAVLGLALWLPRTILERARGRSLAVYVQLVLAFPVLTFVLPSATTRSGILIHIYDEVFALGRVPRGADIAKAVMLALSSINRLASTALLTGGITPVMSAAIIGGLSWTGWFALMAVPYWAILVLGGLLTYALYRRGFAHGLPVPERERRRPISGTEWRTLAIILGASALWL